MKEASKARGDVVMNQTRPKYAEGHDVSSHLCPRTDGYFSGIDAGLGETCFDDIEYTPGLVTWIAIGIYRTHLLGSSIDWCSQ